MSTGSAESFGGSAGSSRESDESAKSDSPDELNDPIEQDKPPERVEPRRVGIFSRIFSVKPGLDDHVISVIGDTRLFENLSLSDIEKLSEQVRIRSYDEGDRIFSEGDEGDGLYVIEEGSVEVYVTSAGSRKKLVVLHDRDYFGEMALIDDDGRRTASVEARKPTKCLYLSKAAFDDLLGSSHVTAAKILFQLCRVLSRRLARTSHR